MIRKSLIILFILLIASGFVMANETPVTYAISDNNKNVQLLDTIVVSYNKSYSVQESLFPEKSLLLGASSHFSWGADVGASIDLRSLDMSTFDIDVFLGYKNKFIRTIGAGTGIHRAFGNGHNFIPFYVIFRSSFTSKPTLFFFDFKGGYVLNTNSENHTNGGVYMNVGVGVNLAITPKLNSHITLGYGLMGIKDKNIETHKSVGNPIHYAQIKFGISF